MHGPTVIQRAIGRSIQVDVPLLLAAVSATSPCGEDLEYDADFLRLERESRGQPERSMGDSILPAEPPEWRSIQQQSLDLLQRSKDLRITHFLLQSSLALEGIPGLARVLTLISELLKQYWADLHPRLDADDDNDPTVRINALTGLTSDVTIRLLRESILVRSRAFGTITLRAAANASGLQSFADESLGSEQLAGALLDSDPEQLENTRAALQEARNAAEAIEQQVSDQVGSAQGVDLGPLKQPLKMALQILGQSGQQSGDSTLSDAVSSDSSPSTQHADAPSAPRNTGTSTVSGEINNRDDVLRSLDRVLAYYTRHEPSSPLPVLLNRAKLLVNADFATIVRNLIPDGMSQFENLRGPDSE
nr:type VI secretion system protein TssA [Pseudomonas uvaldensis]